MSGADHRLSDVGEEGILRSLVFNHLAGSTPKVALSVGDDAALLEGPGPDHVLAVTVDPCPTPIVDLLGLGSYRDWGRLSGVISLSDLAAMGAAPVGLLSSTAMPPSMTVGEYEDFLTGLEEICAEFATPIIGGNIREAESFNATTVGLGMVHRAHAFRRNGAGPGDRVIAIGSSGSFWAAVLSITEGGMTPSAVDAELYGALFAPSPKLRESLALVDAGLVTAGIDCSDGLGEGLSQLAAASHCGVHIVKDQLEGPGPVREAADRLGIDEINLRLSWGDWQLLVAVRPSDVGQAIRCVTEAGGVATEVANLVADPGAHLVDHLGGAPRPMDRLLGSRRFTSDSYMSAGIAPYVELLRQPLAALGGTPSPEAPAVGSSEPSPDL